MSESAIDTSTPVRSARKPKHATYLDPSALAVLIFNHKHQDERPHSEELLFVLADNSRVDRLKMCSSDKSPNHRSRQTIKR